MTQLGVLRCADSTLNDSKVTTEVRTTAVQGRKYTTTGGEGAGDDHAGDMPGARPDERTGPAMRANPGRPRRRRDQSRAARRIAGARAGAVFQRRAGTGAFGLLVGV